MNLTPLGIGVLVFAALLGVAAQWNPALGGAPWWGVAIALVAVGVAVELVVSRHRELAARWKVEPLHLGRRETLQLELENESPRGVAVAVAPVLPDAFDELGPETAGRHLAAGEVALVAVAARPVELGHHAAPGLPVRVLGPFGLAWWSRRIDMPERFAVRPDTLARGGHAQGFAESGAAARQKLGTGGELSHLREYRRGDALRSIDWKATARSPDLVTRVYTDDRHAEIVVMIDAGRTSRTELDGMSQLGHYVNFTARFAERCADGDDRVGLITFADRPLRIVPPGRGVESVVRVRSALSGLTPQAVESDTLNAALQVSRLVRHRCLVIMLTDLYESSSTGRLVRAARLLAPKHMVMMVGLIGDEVAELAGGTAADWLDPFRALAAREHARHVAANVAQLRELGVLAMTSSAAMLERRLLERYSRLRAQRRI